MYRHHVEPRVKLYSPREESFPIPLKYIDVSRTTHTNLDVMKESRIDDYWNIDGSRDLSDSWTDFTQFTLLSEIPPDGCLGWDWQNGKRHPDQIIYDQNSGEEWQRTLSWGRSINGQLKKPMLDNARRYYDKSISLTLRTWSSRKKKIGNTNDSSYALQDMQEKQAWETRSKTNDFRSKYACILEVSESTRMRMEECLPKYHEDHIAGKGDNSLKHYNLGHKFIPMPQAMKVPQQKQQWINNRRNLKRFRRGT